MADKKISVKITADSKSAEKSMEKVTEALNGLSGASSKSDSAMNKSAVILRHIAKMFEQLNADVRAMRDSISKLDEKPVKRVGDAMEKAGKQAKRSAKSTKDAASQFDKLNALASTVAGVQLGGAAGGIISSIAGMGAASIQAAAQMRQYEIAFQTMLKSASDGTQMLRDLQQFAAETPFDVPGVVSAGQQLMAFGFKAKEIIPMLTSLGDAASGLGLGTEGVSRLAYALGQMQTSGKLNAQDMMQLTSAGISAWDMLAQAAGKTVAEMKDLCSKGAIDSKAAVQTIVAGMNEQFGGMMAKTSDEVSGLLANIEETAGNTSAAIGKYMTEAFNVKGALKNVSDALGEFQQKMQEATDKGKSFTDVLKECVPGSVIMAFGTLATVIGGALVAAIVAAVAAIGAAIGVSAAVVGALAAVGVALTAVVVYWDEIVDAFNVGINAILDLVVILGTAITEGILGIVKFISGQIGEIFADATGKQDNWFNSFSTMLGDAMDEVEEFAKKAISWFDKVFAAKKAVVDTRNADAELAQIQEDYKIYEEGKKTTRKPDSGNLFQNLDKGNLGSGRTSALKQENVALKALQDENRIAQERKKIENDYVRLVLKKEKDMWTAQNAIAKKYGTDAQKYQIQLNEIEFNKKQELQEENLAYTEQMLAAENAIKEAQLRGASQKELDMLKEKLQLIKDTHAYTVDNIEKTAIANTNSAQTDYSNKQIGWQASYNASGTVGQMNMANDKWKDDATASVNANPWANDEMKLEMLTAINKKYDEQQQKINTISKIQQVSNQLAKDFSGAITDWITGAQSFGDAMKSILQQLIAQLIQAALYATIVAACTGGGGGFAARWNGAFGNAFASGGAVDGPGTGTSDSIPAMLSNGEYVLNAQAVDRLGVPFLNGLNTGRFKGFASGGLVGSGGAYNRSASGASSSSSTSNSITLNVSALDASSFADFLARGGMQVLKQATLDDNRNFNAAFDTF